MDISISLFIIQVYKGRKLLQKYFEPIVVRKKGKDGWYMQFAAVRLRYLSAIIG